MKSNAKIIIKEINKELKRRKIKTRLKQEKKEGIIVTNCKKKGDL